MSETAAAAGWRTMDSAPKDGTWFLAHGDGDGWEICDFICHWDSGDWYEPYSDVIARPTHWLPLPPPPAKAQA